MRTVQHWQFGAYVACGIVAFCELSLCIIIIIIIIRPIIQVVQKIKVQYIKYNKTQKIKRIKETLKKLRKNHTTFRNVLQVFYVPIPFILALCCSALRHIMDIT